MWRYGSVWLLIFQNLICAYAAQEGYTPHYTLPHAAKAPHKGSGVSHAYQRHAHTTQKNSDSCTPVAGMCMPDKKDIWCVIFIHGTLGAKQNVSLHNFFCCMCDKVEGTPYERSIDIMRENAYLYAHQAIGHLGLHPITQVSSAGAQLSKEYFDEQFKQWYAPHSSNLYYTFGWSGILSEKLRQKSACRLYKELIAEKHRLQTLFPNNSIRVLIIGYSHGGTVALDMIHCHENCCNTCEPNASWKSTIAPKTITPLVDALVLIGTPIIRRTAELASNPLIGKAYSIYSRADKVQRLDRLSMHHGPKRRFSQFLKKKHRNKLYNAELQLWSNHDSAICGCNNYYNRNPGHIELWFFGWDKPSYRTNFPIDPLPALIFVPYCMSLCHHQAAHGHDIIVELYTECDKSFIRKKGNYRRIQVPSCNPEDIVKYRAKAKKSRPALFNKKIHDQQIRTAIRQAYGLIQHVRARNFSACSTCQQ